MTSEKRRLANEQKTIDLTNKKFGKLKVISKSDERGNRGQIKWNCICKCGNSHVVSGDCLRAKRSKSCGCELGRKAQPNREKYLLKNEYTQIRKRHKKFNGELMDFDTFTILSKSTCKCGITFSKEIEDRISKTKNKEKITDFTLQINGIDRINSGIGYTKENCVACCKNCNYAKNSMSEQEFIEWIKRVYKNLNLQS